MQEYSMLTRGCARRICTGTAVTKRSTDATTSCVWRRSSNKQSMWLTGCLQILGHEFVGVVSEVGSAVTAFKVGDEVVAPFTWCAPTWTTPDCIETNQSSQPMWCLLLLQARRKQPLRGVPDCICPTTALTWLCATRQHVLVYGTAAFTGVQSEYAYVAFADSTLVHAPPAVSPQTLILMGASRLWSQ